MTQAEKALEQYRRMLAEQRCLREQIEMHIKATMQKINEMKLIICDEEKSK